MHYLYQFLECLVTEIIKDDWNIMDNCLFWDLLMGEIISFNFKTSCIEPSYITGYNLFENRKNRNH